MRFSFKFVIFSILNVILGVVLQFSGVFLIGVGSETDAFYLAQIVPFICSTILLVAVSNNLTALTVGLIDAKGVGLVRYAVVLYGGLLLVFFIFIGVIREYWFSFFFFSNDKIIYHYSVYLIALFLVVSWVRFVNGVLIAWYVGNQQWEISEYAQLFSIILSLFFVHYAVEEFGIAGFVGVLIAREMMVFFILGSYFLLKDSVSDSSLRSELNSRVRSIFKMSVVFKMGPLIDRVILSGTATGILTCYSLGQQISGVALSVADKALARPFLVLSASKKNGGKVLKNRYEWVRKLVLAAAIVAIFVGFIGYLFFENSFLHEWLLKKGFSHLDIVALSLVVIVPGVLSQITSSIGYGNGRVNEIKAVAWKSFALSNAIKVLGYFVFGAYAVVVGGIIYQLLNWLMLERRFINKGGCNS